MVAPEILSVREFRAGLAGVLKQVNEPGGGPVLVGPHRKPEAVVMSVSQYEALREAAERRRAVESALGSLRAEGLEPTLEGQELLEGIVEGRLTTAEARKRILARYGT